MAPGASNSSNTTSSGGSYQPQGKGDSKPILKFFYWVVVCVTVICAYANIRPYAIAIKHFLGVQVDTDFLRLIGQLPIINGLAAIIGTSAYWVIGALFWLLLQTIEVFPIVLQRDKAFVRTLIHASEQHQKFQVKDTDDPTLSALKRWYNLFPSVTISRARNLALFCYVIDFLVVSAVYPPAKNFGAAFMYIMTGQFNRLNWTNIFYLLLTLFAVEALIRVLFWLGEIIYFMRSAHKN